MFLLQFESCLLDEKGIENPLDHFDKSDSLKLINQKFISVFLRLGLLI